MAKPKKTKQSKFMFTLKNVNMRSIDEKYRFIVGTDITDTDMPINATKLTELGTERATPELISFLDEAKRSHTCHVSMIDHSTQVDVSMLRYDCYWCRYPFDTRGIGCPVRYIPSQAVKTFYSEISRDTRTIKENITDKRRTILNDPRVFVEKADYYETDGVFCSFNCCQAWIDDNKHDSLYDPSHSLLIKMYCDMMNVKAVEIKAAPHWRLRRESGGHYTHLTFREGFGKVEYDYCGTFFKFRPIGRMYEEKLHF